MRPRRRPVMGEPDVDALVRRADPRWLDHVRDEKPEEHRDPGDERQAGQHHDDECELRPEAAEPGREATGQCATIGLEHGHLQPGRAPSARAPRGLSLPLLRFRLHHGGDSAPRYNYSTVTGKT